MKEIKIGNQIWMAENLNVDKFINGDFIPVNDPRGLAPKGWKIPSYNDWKCLINFLGGDSEAVKKMKSTSGWADNGNGTNSGGFSGLPGGWRDYDDAFCDFG